MPPTPEGDGLGAPAPVPLNPGRDTPATPDDGGPPEPGGPEARPPAGRDVRSGRSRRASTIDTTWRVWWDLNRAHLTDIKSRARRRAVTTGVGTDAAIDPLGTKRDEVREMLRKLVIEQRDRTLRGGALIALGRFGDEGDVDLFFKVLDNRRHHQTVHESAALALGMLPPIEDQATRDRVLERFTHIIKHPKTHLSVRAREFVILAAGMRAQHDKRLLAPLLARLHAPLQNTNEYGALTFAAGLSRDPMAVPELLAIARTGAVGKKKVHDVLRAHAVTAVSLSESPYLAEHLTAILRSRRSGIHTRRSAALALGRLLRETEVSPAAAKAATDRLRKALDTSGDSLLRGFCALALGGARDPQGIGELIKAVEGGDAQVKHFSALALGLALPKLDGIKSRRVRSLLTEELQRAHDDEHVSALCIAVGLGGVTEAKLLLLERLKSYKRKGQGGCAEAGRRFAPFVHENGCLKIEMNN